MKIYQLLHNILDKFVPMDDTEKIKLLTKASDSYGKLLAEALTIKEEAETADAFNTANAQDIVDGKTAGKVSRSLNLAHRAILLCEQWYMGYVFAILFVIAVPWIKRIMSGENRRDDGEENDDFHEFMEYQRFRKNHH